MEYFITGEMKNVPGSIGEMEYGLSRDKKPEGGTKLRTSAIATAFTGNGRVIAAYDSRQHIIAWIQCVHIDVLFGPSIVAVCRYSIDDTHTPTNVMEALLESACWVGCDPWGATQLHMIVGQATLLPNLGRVEAVIVPLQNDPSRWLAVIEIDGGSPVDDQLLPCADPLIPKILATERRWKLVRF